ncbi:MAG: hypothetical protein BGN92_10610 [Sphingobacteriales bacterium 41-5]|nr:MAG: hypothetical protein BGN92_10610 [Sphingobacteriales bacterium 41-5]
MKNENQYNLDAEAQQPVLKEPDVFMRTFSSQEEADLYRLRKNLARTDMERFEMLCRMMRIGKMLNPQNVIEK